MILVNLRPGEQLKIDGPAIIKNQPERSSRLLVDAPKTTVVCKVLSDGSIAGPTNRRAQRAD